MEETVASLSLAVHEKLELKKNRLSPLPGNDSGKRICVVTGVHGDELEGQYVIYLLNRRIQAHPELLTGTVDIYPAVNPLGINTIQRGIPLFDLDMNRIFPGDTEGPMAEYYAHAVVEDTSWKHPIARSSRSRASGLAGAKKPAPWWPLCAETKCSRCMSARFW